MNKIRLIACILLVMASQFAFAKDGYHIQINFKNTAEKKVYLVHYFGKPLPTIYKTDSATIDKSGKAVFDTKEFVLGGIYMMLLADQKTYFEFLLKNGDDMSINADVSKIPGDGLSFKNAPENERFSEYTAFLKDFGQVQQDYQAALQKATSQTDSNAIYDNMRTAGKQLISFRKNYQKKYPNTLLSTIFHALEIPDVPEGKHYNADGSLDTQFAYHYYKNHYWDGFDFKDDRLINTPIFDPKLDEYFNKLVVPIEDSVIKEADWMLAQTKGQKELFKYALWWITRYVENSKIMGMDKVFVYLVENYYMRGAATWLDNDELGKYYDRASKITPNLIGRIAPEIKMVDIKGKERKLSDVKSKYTLVIFWDPTCGHCTKEIPQIDSLYKAVLKKKGVTIYSVRTEGEEKVWQEFIRKNKLEDWINVYDPTNTSNYRSMYDVYSTPVVYLLDEKKIIRGKRIDHTNILSLIDMMERKEDAPNGK